MKNYSVLILLVCICLYPFATTRGVNGGMSCAVCTVLTGIVMQVAEIHEEDLFNATKRFCNYLPSKVRNPCFEILDQVEPYLSDFSETLTPDLFCLIYGTCKRDTNGNLCHLFPLNLTQEERPRLPTSLPEIDFCELPVIKDICKILNNSFISLNPLEDFDKDGFSSLATGRGSDWRGKDCADNNPQIYPGRRPLSSDLFSDSNCNGIWGLKDGSSLSWEQLLCKESLPRGLIYIGDSIGAHFHMPEVWMNPLLFTLPVLNASNVILDEIDWPQYGFVTGFQNITKNILIEGLTDSIYLRLKKRNRCNHRDYQNLSQNGASSYNGVTHAQAVARNQSVDNPAIVMFAMQGNDVCNNFNETIDHTTPPTVFKRNVMKTLFLLDQKLPNNSHVILVELVEANYIYSAMAERLHPIGTLHKNVYYKDMYEWFNCLQIGPCTGWLNSDRTLREHTSQKARTLNKVLRKIAKREKFEHFDLHTIKNPITYMVRNFNISIPDLLEAVDSLHPNQKAQVLIANITWNMMEQLPPDVLGPINPNNEIIEKIFGDQGGH